MELPQYEGLADWCRAQAGKGLGHSDCYAEAVKRFGYGSSSTSFRKYFSARCKAPGPAPTVAAVPNGGRDCRSLDAFRVQYDDSIIIPQRIEKAVETHLIENGEPAWMRDAEFREACGIPVARWRRYADEYRHLQVKAPGGEIIWGHPDIIEEMRMAVQR